MEELKFLLKVSGQPQVEPNGKRIGPLPDLREAATLLLNSTFLWAPAFNCSNCENSYASSSEFPPPRFEPAPGYESAATKHVQLQVPRGINPDHVTIACTLDGSEPEPGNPFLALAPPGDEIEVEPGQRLRAKTVLNYQLGTPPSWAATESQAVRPPMKGAPPLRPGKQIYLMPGGNQELKTTLTLFTTDGDVPDPEGLGYDEGGIGREVGPDGLVRTIYHPTRFIARSYMRGLCNPDAEDSDDWECAPASARQVVW